jgi:hypothetical protein
MNPQPVFFCIILLLTISISGCTITPFPATNTTEKSVDNGQTPLSTAVHPTFITYQANPTTNSTTIPVLLTDTDWKVAGDCGWMVNDLPKTTALLMNDCQVQHLLGDGWEIVGIGYDMNFLGSRCRKTTHPDATGTCNWCLDSGPTLALRYRGVMTTRFLANVKGQTVTRFWAELPEGAASVSTGDSDIIKYRNGTVLYTFRNC